MVEHKKGFCKNQLKHNSLVVLILSCFLSFLISNGANASADFDRESVKSSIVDVNVVGFADRRKVIHGIAISPTILMTTEDALKGYEKELSIGDALATPSLEFDEQNLALISYPAGGFKPVILASELGSPGRNIHFVSGRKDNYEVVSGTIVNLVSRFTKTPGYFDSSISPALIRSAQAFVFNNCGQLIGIFDRSESKEVAVVKALDDLIAVSKSVIDPKITQEVCLSEVEKLEQKALALADAERERKELESLEMEAQAQLEKFEAELLEAKKSGEESAIAAAEDAKKQAAVELEEVRQATALQIKENETKLAEAEEEKRGLEEESEELLEKTKNQYLIILLVILFIAGFLFFVSRTKPSPELAADSQDGKISEDGIDLIIRGDGLSLKIPEELLKRDRGVLLGRSAADCDYVLDAPSISRSHARVTMKDGILYIEDLGSANGTSVNGLRLKAGQAVALHGDDDLNLADSAFSVEMRSR